MRFPSSSFPKAWVQFLEGVRATLARSARTHRSRGLRYTLAMKRQVALQVRSVAVVAV